MKAKILLIETKIDLKKDKKVIFFKIDGEKTLILESSKKLVLETLFPELINYYQLIAEVNFLSEFGNVYDKHQVQIDYNYWERILKEDLIGKVLESRINNYTGLLEIINFNI